MTNTSSLKAGRRRLCTTGTTLILSMLFCSAIYGSAVAQQPAGPPPAVGVRPAELKGVARSYEFVGRVKAINTVQVRARVEGFLDEVKFKEGQDVKAGEVLYEIEKTTYQAQVEQAQANLVAARAQALNAKLQYNRSYQLSQNQNAPQSKVDQDKAAMDIADAQVYQTQAALDLARVNLGYTDIISPIDGRIGLTTYTKGNLVNPASGVLATIVSQDPIYAEFPVSQRQLEEIREARKLPDGKQIKIEIVVKLANGKQYPHPGTWNFTDVQVNQQTDTLLMRATIPNPERFLVDGQFAMVSIRERREQMRLVIPLASLQLDQAGSYVLVVDDANKVEMRRLKLGPKEDTEIVVEEGLKEGERVIVDGIQKVRVGQQVTISPAAGKGA